MSTATFYKDKDLEVTSDLVRGPRGAFSIGSIDGVEYRFPYRALLVALCVAVPPLHIIANTHSGLLHTVAYLAWALICVFIVSLFFGRQVVLRVKGAVVALGVVRGKLDRERITSAFHEARCSAS